MSVTYWRSPEGLRHITPGRQEWPEGRDFPHWLAAKMPWPVLELGCGTGRLAEGWVPGSYIGVDVSPYALKLAHEGWPDHDFRLIAEHEDPPAAEAAFAHTVLLHVPDAELPAAARRLAAAAPVVFVSEIMGRKWRRAGKPPVFNREPEEYVDAFEAAGMCADRHWELPYARYGGVTFDVLEFLRYDVRDAGEDA